MNERGFTLVELLIGITIFSVGVLAVASMQTTAMQANALSTNLTQAIVQCSQDKLEGLLALDYGHSDLDAGDHGPEVEDNYTVSWHVDADSPYTGAKTISVTTTWRDQSGNHSVTTAVIKDALLD